MNATTARTNLGLGNSATKNTGTSTGTVAAGDDARIVNSVQYVAAPSGNTNGVADTAAITAAITALGATGGQVILAPGTYYSTGITDGGKPVTIRGAGVSGTKLKAAAGFTGTVLTLATNYSTTHHLTIEGDSSATCGLACSNTRAQPSHLQVSFVNGDGIKFTGITTSNAKVSNVQVSSCVNGVTTTGNGTDVQLVHVTVDSCTGVGFNIAANSTQLSQCHAWGNGIGVKVRASNVRFSNCFVETSTTYGYDVASCTNVRIKGGDVWRNGSDGIHYDTVTKFTLSDVAVYENGARGIALLTCSGFSVVNNQCWDSRGTRLQTYGLYFDACTLFAVTGNYSVAADHVTGGIRLTSNSSSHKFSGNSGFESSGTGKKQSAAVTPSATANTYGTANNLTADLPSTYINPVRLSVQSGGTFTGGETLTMQVTATFSDGSTQSVTKTATGSGFQDFALSDFYSLLKSQVWITKFATDCKSSIASSTATCTFFHAVTNV